VSSEAPAEAMRLLRDIIARNQRVAKSGPARRIATSRHYVLLRYWFSACFEYGRQVALDDVREIANHIGAICRSAAVKRLWIVEWWETILALVIPPGSQDLVGPTVSIERWIQRPARRHQVALEALAGLKPKVAKESLKRHWNGLSPSDQTFLLVSVRRTFSLEDEEFLRSATESRRKRVREVATEIWCSIRGSTLAERLWHDVSHCVRVQAGSIVLTPPERHTPAMAALGVSKKSLWQGLSDEESWLRSCLSHLPCGYWSDNLKMSPADLLRMMVSSHVGAPYLSALQFSAKHSREPSWARALIESEDVFRAIYGKSSDAVQKTMKPVWYCDLARVLPPAEREAHLERVLDSLPWVETFDDAPLLIWSREFSGGAVGGAQRSGYFANISSPEEAFLNRSSMEPLAWHLTSASDEVLDELTKGGEGSRIAATELKLTLSERDQIRAAFKG
jgi:hypothetical protein